MPLYLRNVLKNTRKGVQKKKNYNESDVILVDSLQKKRALFYSLDCIIENIIK